MSDSIGDMLGKLANTNNAFSYRERGRIAAELAILLQEKSKELEVAWYEERIAELESLLKSIVDDPNTHRIGEKLRDEIDSALSRREVNSE